jgi:hypothetical protein
MQALARTDSSVPLCWHSSCPSVAASVVIDAHGGCKACKLFCRVAASSEETLMVWGPNADKHCWLPDTTRSFTHQPKAPGFHRGARWPLSPFYPLLDSHVALVKPAPVTRGTATTDSSSCLVQSESHKAPQSAWPVSSVSSMLGPTFQYQVTRLGNRGSPAKIWRITMLSTWSNKYWRARVASH